MDWKKTVFSLLGPACVLLGLGEIIRLILLYSAAYSFYPGFPLEVGIYVIGIIWTIMNYAEDIKSLQQKVHFPQIGKHLTNSKTEKRKPAHLSKNI